MDTNAIFIFVNFRRVKELEVDVVQVGNTLRSMTINEEKASKSQEGSTSKLKQKEAELEDVRN